MLWISDGVGGRARAASLDSMGATPHGGEGRLKGIGRAQVEPIFCREIMGGEERILTVQ
jgi:hypothetical protein